METRTFTFIGGGTNPEMLPEYFFVYPLDSLNVYIKKIIIGWII